MFQNGSVEGLLDSRRSVCTSHPLRLTKTRSPEQWRGFGYEIQVQVLVVTRRAPSRRAIWSAGPAVRLGDGRSGALRIHLLGVPGD